jgi:DNA-binding response OmpR family regulator
VNVKQTVLVVEDDTAILAGLVDLLEGEGFLVHKATNGTKALQIYETHKPDLILLDIMIPEKSGYDVCREIRRKDQKTAIVMLTAKGEEIDKVVGLEIGADDYIVKPFAVSELVARVRAALRRSRPGKAAHEPSDRPISFGDVRIDPATLRGRKGKHEFALSTREVRLIQLLVEHEGEALDRFKILDEIWGVRYEGTTRTLDQHIAKLRQKIEDHPSDPRHILTVHGVGYRFSSK